MERECYTGIFGMLLKFDLYLTLGISGQIRHTVGGNGTKVIVAIDKDKNTPIFNYTDYGLVGDTYKAVPALISQLSRQFPSNHISRYRRSGKGAQRMSDDKFDAIVAGADVAGSVATPVMTRAEPDVPMIERGDNTGCKNMTGGRLYAHTLEVIIPGSAASAPIERKITCEKIPFLAEENAATLDFHREQSDVP